MFSAKTKWDLSKYFYKDLNDPQIQIDIDDSIKNVDDFISKYKGKISTLTPEEFLTFLEEESELVDPMIKVSFYYSFLSTLNTQDQEVIRKEGELDNKWSDLSEKLIFVTDELKQLGVDALLNYSEMPELEPYKNFLVQTAIGLKYVLDTKSEEILNQKGKVGRVMKSLYEEYTNSLMFDVEINGEKKTITESEVRALRLSPDPIVRRESYRSLVETYLNKQTQITLGNAYVGIVKNCITTNKIRGYQSVMESRNVSEELSFDAVNTLINTVRSSFPIFHKYLKLKAKVMGMEKLPIEDILAPVSTSEKNIDFAEGLMLYLEAIRDFDPYFYKYSTEIFENGRVDVFSKPGKRGGAYANYHKGFPSFVMLNYTNTFSDVMTLAHELGHAIHGALSQAQVGQVYSTPLSLAETASIFNETYVFEKLLKTIDEEEQIHYLFERLSDIFSTTFRQIAYIMFERNVHEAFSKGQELTYENFNVMWREVMNELYGDSVEFSRPANEEIGWSTIPHIFNTPFYCYAYSFGNLLSLSLYSEYEKRGAEFVPDYINLLMAGGSKTPEDLLKDFGYDINNESFYKGGIAIISKMVDDLESLLNKKAS